MCERAEVQVQRGSVDLTEELVSEAVHDCTESLNCLRVDEQALTEALLDEKEGVDDAFLVLAWRSGLQ